MSSRDPVFCPDCAHERNGWSNGTVKCDREAGGAPRPTRKGYRSCGCRDEGPPCQPGYHHQGHDVCNECGTCKECDLPIPDTIRQEYLALARFANGLYWALAQGPKGLVEDE